jgi:hypothetical protein
LLSEAHQVMPKFVGIESRAEILHAHLPVGIDERGELGMIDRAVLLLGEEYPIMARRVTDRLGRTGQKGPAVELRTPELGVVLQHLRRVVLGVEADRNKGDLGAEIRTQFVLDLHHLLRQERADVGAFGIDEGQRHDLAAQVGERHRLSVLRGQAKGRRRPDHRQPLVPAGFMRRQ